MARREELQPLNLKDVLSTILVDDLRTMVRTLHKHLKTDRSGSFSEGLEPVSHRKPDVINWIQTVITDSKRARLLSDNMHSLEQAALSETVHAPGGVLDRSKIAAKCGRYPLLTTTGRSGLVGGETPPTPGEKCPLLSNVLAGQSRIAMDVQAMLNLAKSSLD
ncbi:MAG: hypothetical protein K9J81_12720 [Desulfohalobiaceae bacterium]|nr:hypothetical protein [Desulfohalobiaceae bacterium]